MKLTALSVDGFKNLKGVSLIPDPSYNLILGENAQGKTNLLEAIWTLTGCRSFRGTRERDYLPFSGGNLQVEAKFQDARREQSVRLCMVSGTVPEKKIWCNDVPQKSSALFSVFHCVTFTPEDLSLVEGGPERRRTFLDLCSAQLHAPMLGLVRRYQLALQQRNAVLKQRLPEAQAAGLLEIWDRQLEQLGTEIAVQRGIYVRRLAEVCVPLYAQIARGRKPFPFTISPACSEKTHRTPCRKRGHRNWCSSTAKKCGRAAAPTCCWDIRQAGLIGMICSLPLTVSPQRNSARRGRKKVWLWL